MNMEQLLKWELAGETEIHNETQLQYDLTWDQTQAAMVGSWQLTSWTIWHRCHIYSQSTFFSENEWSNFTLTQNMGKTTDIHIASLIFLMDHNSCTWTLRSSEVKHREGSDITQLFGPSVQENTMTTAVKIKNVTLSLCQAMKPHRVMRHQASHISSRESTHRWW
jgi:hypothetical protein